MNTFCTNCGQALTGNTQFCPSCGCPVSGQAPSKETDKHTETTKDTAKKRSFLPAIIISGAVLLLLIAGVVIALVMMNSNEEERVSERKSKASSHRTEDDAEAEHNSKERKKNVLDGLFGDSAAEAAAPAAVEEAAPAAVEEAAPAADTSEEDARKEMYYEVSRLFGGMEFYDGTTFGWFDPYTGREDDSFFTYGDGGWNIEYGGITSFSNNRVTIGKYPYCDSFEYMNPWTIAYLDADEYVMDVWYCGSIESIEQDMRYGNGPQYIIPESDRVILEDYNVEISGELARYAKNEIYARHGRKFKDKELQAYFDRRNWYMGTVDPDRFSESVLSEIEKKNIQYLKSRENL
ncbi:MAG: YARHG domain-containing protein [Lachnospiraceae bacterium]|nr:YARHG domain-containing protein [Lachnospiraceae bacterium]